MKITNPFEHPGFSKNHLKMIFWYSLDSLAKQWVLPWFSLKFVFLLNWNTVYWQCIILTVFLGNTIPHFYCSYTPFAPGIGPKGARAGKHSLLFLRKMFIFPTFYVSKEWAVIFIVLFLWIIIFYAWMGSHGLGKSWKIFGQGKSQNSQEIQRDLINQFLYDVMHCIILCNTE